MSLRARIADRLDRALALARWPVGLAALAALPGTVLAGRDLLAAVAADARPVTALLLGMIAWFVGWAFLFRGPRWGSALTTFEHEITHALFAWATLHPVVDIRVTWRSGGHVRYRGRGNWLIDLAPYFFPTVALVAGLAVLLWRPGPTGWLKATLGVAVAYHLTSTSEELHAGQTDLRKAGYAFCAAFLPTANLLCYGALLAAAYGGSGAAGDFLRGVLDHSLALADRVAG